MERVEAWRRCTSMSHAYRAHLAFEPSSTQGIMRAKQFKTEELFDWPPWTVKEGSRERNAQSTEARTCDPAARSFSQWISEMICREDRR